MSFNEKIVKYSGGMFYTTQNCIVLLWLFFIHQVFWCFTGNCEAQAFERQRAIHVRDKPHWPTFDKRSQNTTHQINIDKSNMLWTQEEDKMRGLAERFGSSTIQLWFIWILACVKHNDVLKYLKRYHKMYPYIILIIK